MLVTDKRKYMSQCCHFLHHKYHIDWWEAGNWTSEPWNILRSKTNLHYISNSVRTSEKTVWIHKIEIGKYREIKMFIAQILRTPKDTLSECVVLDALVKLWKATLTLVCLSVRPSAPSSAWNNSTLTEHIFYRNFICQYFPKSVEKFQVSWKSDESDGYFTCRPKYIYDHTLLNSS
jgi:hypothetical protein